MDFILRFCAGGRASVQGSLAEFGSFFFRPDMTAGPPKQFAALCGVIFSGLATLFLFLGDEGQWGAGNGEGFTVTARVILGCLIVAAGLEAFFGICAGCIMFSYMVKLGLFSHHLFDICEDSIEETEFQLASERNWPIGSKFTDWLVEKAPWLRKLSIGSNSFPPEKVDYAMEKIIKKETKKKHNDDDDGGGKGADEDGEDHGENSDDESGYSDLENQDSKRGEKLTSRERGGLWHRFTTGRLVDGRDQVKFVPKFKEKEAREILDLAQEEATLDNIDSEDGRRIHDKRNLYYTPQIEEYIQTKWNPIRSMKITYFGAVMGILGLAAVWKQCEDVFGTSKAWWATFGIGGASVMLVFLVLYLIKMVLYPRKVRSEWQCPIQSNFFSAIPLNILLLAYLTSTESSVLSQVLFWIGAPFQLISGIFATAKWILVPHYIETINPNWMIPVLGNLVAAFVAPATNIENDEVAWLWFGFAVVYWVPLFAMTVMRVTTRENLDERILPSLFIWVAAPAVACSAYISIITAECRNQCDTAECRNQCDPWQGDSFPKILYFATLAIFATLSCMFLFRYFAKIKFEMGYWGYTFPLATLSIVTMQYYVYIDVDLVKAMSYLSIILVTWAVGMCFIHTLLLLLKREDLFCPNDKWGPMSFMKITHYAFRYGWAQLERRAKFLDPEDRRSIVKFAHLFLCIELLHQEHSKHEDLYMYPMLNSYFPGYTRWVSPEHEEGIAEFQQLRRHVDILLQSDDSSNVAQAIEAIKEAVPEMGAHLIAHLDYEEFHINHVGKKYFNWQIAKGVVRSIFESTSAEKWYILMPFIINNVPYYGRKIRFLVCLRWAMPERIQLIGGMIYDGVSPVMWKRLVRFVPQMIPRGISGWSRYY